jgi:excisionase family DNA binding protein
MASVDVRFDLRHDRLKLAAYVLSGPLGHSRSKLLNSAPRALPPEHLLKVREVTARLGVCRATVYAMVERGERRCVRVSNAVRFYPTDLALLLARSRS